MTISYKEENPIFMNMKQVSFGGRRGNENKRKTV